MRNIIIIIILAFLPVCLSAQKTVKGVVKDNKREALPGVSISEVGNSSNETMTDIDGNYTISLRSDASRILVQYMGFKEQTLKPSDNMVITLQIDENVLEQVDIVRIGYGTKTKISNIAAISQVGGKTLSMSPTSNVQNALAGRLPGLSMLQGNGQPGKDASELIIRGASTYSASTAPLVLIDDIESDLATFTRMTTDEIEDINILKDAGATSIYGIKGGNGVILITTKRGHEGPARVTFTADVGFERPTFKTRFLDSYNSLSLIREMHRNDGNITSIEEAPQLFSDESLQKFKEGSDPYLYPNVDWSDLLLREMALRQQYGINIQGGTKDVKYFMSMGYMDQRGLLKSFPKPEEYNNEFYQKRYNIRSNIDLQITKDFSMKLSASGTIAEVNEPNTPNIREAGEFSIWRRLFGGRWTPWNYPAYNPDGTFGGIAGKSANPIALLTYGGYNREFRNNVNGNVSLKHKLDFITKGLEVQGLLAVTNSWAWKRSLTRSGNSAILDFEYDRINSIYRPITTDNYVLKPLVAAQSNIAPNLAITSKIDLSYNRKFGVHSIDALAFAEWRSNRTGKDTPNNDIKYSGRIAYAYASRYFVDFIGSYSGSDRFHKDNRYDFFPAVSVGWILSEEPYMKDFLKSAKFDLLKIRSSYGTTGFDKITSYGYIESFKIDGAYSFGEDPYAINAWTIDAMANTNIVWEKEKKFNIGINITMLKKRLDIEVDYFYNKRSGILAKRNSLLSYAGYPTSVLPNMNIGRTLNKGWDGKIVWRDDIGKDINYSVTGIFGYNKSEILFQDEPESMYKLSMSTGHPIASLFGYIADGFYNTQNEIDNGPYRDGAKLGDIRYRDISGSGGKPDGIIDEYDRTRIGSARPNFTYSMGFSISYKSFDVSTLFQGATGSHLAAQSMLQIGGTNGRPMVIHEGRWTHYDTDGSLVTDPGRLAEMNKDASYPLLTGGNQRNTDQSTFWLRSANYLRWKNVEVGYTLPEHWFTKVGIKSLRVSASGQNLAVWAKGLKDLDVDPESSRSANSSFYASQGPLDTYPQMRTYNFRLQIVF